MSATLTTARAILAALAPLQGTYATGSIVVSSTGATGTLPAGSVAVPIVGGRAQHHLAVVVRKAATGGAWSVAQAGTTVQVESLLAGPLTTVGPGAEFRLWPSVAGIAPVATSQLGISGGIGAQDGLRLLQLWDEIPDQTRWFGVPDSPAVAVQWAGDQNSTGDTTTSWGTDAGGRADIASTSRTYWTDRWEVVLVCAQVAGQERFEQLHWLREQMLERLSMQTVVRGLALSTAQPSRIISSTGGRGKPFPHTAYAVSLSLETFREVAADHTHFPASVPWLSTHGRFVDEAGGGFIFADYIDEHEREL